MIDGFLRKANRPMTMNDPKKSVFPEEAATFRWSKKQ